MGIVDCRADVTANGHQFSVRAATLPPAGDIGERIEVALTGVDSAGSTTASGSFTLPPDGLSAVGKLINQVMSGLSTLNGRPATGPANAQAPWTKEQDDELLERWLAAGDTNAATIVRRNLATHFGRSSGSIRARLLRIGCDPDAPGHAFIPTTLATHPVPNTDPDPEPDDT
ncbi:hypothetical protein JOF56_001442 [Kibdelosporangium banguiense]|uniref:Uncharacterized protein n=1 Tax=Kibdelosporangium banguiense TaxID=1365924 RepID=A0ABS4T9F6_9PSEU|nr:hypothetical protein [Kibdelosporangium banguiense]MBP2321057.1 hypothetical protein [Kibdelosporangium banguiense]